MADAPRSSFIPKQISGTTPKTIQRKRVFSVVNFVSAAILILTFVGAGAAFLYQTLLERQLSTQQEALNEEYRKFNESEIAEVKAFDQKLRLAKYLLENHASPHAILDALEANTKESIQYTNLFYNRRPSGGITLNISGATDEFGKIALQRIANEQNSILANAVVTYIGLNLNEEVNSEGTASAQPVNFLLLANLDVSHIPYVAVEEPAFEGTSSESETENEAVINQTPEEIIGGAPAETGGTTGSTPGSGPSVAPPAGAGGEI